MQHTSIAKSMRKQATNTVLMIRPVQFRMNEQTAINNFYQDQKSDLSHKASNERASDEFNAFVKILSEAGIEVIIVKDDPSKNTPDAVFPNNWVSFHANGNVALYPMFAENRRLERRDDIFDILEEEGFEIDQIIDYTTAEDENLFLEGTGSLVLDHINRKAYCALSARADEKLVIEFCEDFEYTPVIFTAFQTVAGNRLPIYHTNVMMCVGSHFAVICLDSIDEDKERKRVMKSLKDDRLEIIEITEDQCANFAGNMLELLNKKGQHILVMSTAARDSLREDQIARLQKHAEILHVDISTIERLGGGSVRCMMAEVFLPKIS